MARKIYVKAHTVRRKGRTFRVGPTTRTAKQGNRTVLRRAAKKPVSKLTTKQLKAVSNRNPSSLRVRNARKALATQRRRRK